MSERYLVSGEDLTGIADAIREKTGTSDTIIFPDGFVSAIENFSSDDEPTDAETQAIMRTISGYYENIEDGMIANYTFAHCYSLTSVKFTRCDNIGMFAFQNCSSLQTVDFPVCVVVGIGAFEYCSSLQTVSFPVCTTIGTSAFCACSSLQSVSFPGCGTIGGSAFYDCAELSVASFPSCYTILGNAFYGCSKLISLYLTGDTYVTLHSDLVFGNTPFSSSSYTGFFGSIFVPSKMVQNYKTRSVWSLYADRLVGI